MAGSKPSRLPNDGCVNRCSSLMGGNDVWTTTKRSRKKKKEPACDSEDSQEVTASNALEPARIAGERQPLPPVTAVKKEPDDNHIEGVCGERFLPPVISMKKEPGDDVAAEQRLPPGSSIKKEPDDDIARRAGCGRSENPILSEVHEFIRSCRERAGGQNSDDDDRESVETIPEPNAREIEVIFLDDSLSDESPEDTSHTKHNHAPFNGIGASVMETDGTHISSERTSPQNTPFPGIKIKQEPLVDHFTPPKSSSNNLINGAIHAQTNNADQVASNLHSKPINLEEKSLNKRTAETALTEKFEIIKQQKQIKLEPPDLPPLKLISVSEARKRQEEDLAKSSPTSSLLFSELNSPSSSSNVSTPMTVDESGTKKFLIDVMKWFHLCAVYDKNDIEESLDYVSKFPRNVSSGLFYDNVAKTSLVDQPRRTISEQPVRKHLNSENFGFGVPTIHRSVTKAPTERLSQITFASSSGSHPAVTCAAQPTSQDSDNAETILQSVESKVTQLKSKVLGKPVVHPSFNLQPANDSFESRLPKLQSPVNFGFGISKNTTAAELVPQASGIMSSIAPSNVQFASTSDGQANNDIVSREELQNILLNVKQSYDATDINSLASVTCNSLFEPSGISNLQHATCIPPVEPKIFPSIGQRIPVVNRFLVSNDLPTPTLRSSILGKRPSSDSGEMNKAECKQKLPTKDLRNTSMPSTSTQYQPSSTDDFVSLIAKSSHSQKSPLKNMPEDFVLSIVEEIRQASSNGLTQNSHEQILSQPVTSVQTPVYEHLLSQSNVSSNINRRANFPVLNDASMSLVNRDPRAFSVRTSRPTFSARKYTGPDSCVYKNVGKDNIADFLGLILHWNADWLRTQKEVNTCPPICEYYPTVKVSYNNEREYYNTYLPLHLLNIWFSIFEAWKSERGLMIQCKCRKMDVEDSYAKTEWSADVQSTDTLPKRDDIALCKKADGEEVFLLVLRVFESSFDCGRKKKLKIECRSVSQLAVEREDSISLHFLMNVRLANYANHVLKSLHPSMKNLLLQPEHHTDSIELVQLQPGPAPKDMRNDIIKAVKRDPSRVCLVEIVEAASLSVQVQAINIPLLITLVAYTLSQETDRKILVILKDDQLFPDLVRRLKEYNPVLAVRNKEIHLDEGMERLSIDHQIGQGREKNELVNSSRFFLTTFSSYNAGDLLSKYKVICIVQGADRCTEVETVLPLALNTKLILMGRRGSCAALSEMLHRHQYGKSLFARLLEAKLR